MPYFPPACQPKPYYCPNCKAWFQQQTDVMTSCCVLHGPGSCCHHGETQVAEPSDWRNRVTGGQLLQEAPSPFQYTNTDSHYIECPAHGGRFGTCTCSKLARE